MENSELKYADAVKLFMDAGLSETTFRRKVREHPIRHALPAGRSRGMLYSRADVEQALEQSRKETKEATEETTEIQPIVVSIRGETDWAKSSDLPYMLAYDYEMYGPEDTVDISITRPWWEKNPYMARILFDANDRRNIWGGITIMPMEEETIFKLLRDDMTEREIKPEHILTYEKGQQYYGYVASATIKSEHKNHFRRLLDDIFGYWCEQYPAVQLTKLYAYASTDEGLDLMKHLFFSPRYDLSEMAFELDPHRRNPSKVLKAFQTCINSKK